MNSTVELVNLWGDFEEGNPGASIADFCLHYLSKHLSTSHSPDQFEMPMESRMAGLLERLNRYAAHYAKKGLKKVDVNNREDWLFLVSLAGMDAPRKSNLIHEMLVEFPTGIEVINRLIRAGMIYEFPDPDDKRAKRVNLTGKGKAVLQGSVEEMNKVGTMAFRALNKIERAALLRILRKLEDFHGGHYRQSKNLDFEDSYQLLVAPHRKGDEGTGPSEWHLKKFTQNSILLP